MLKTHSFSALAGFSKVDIESGVIHGVSVITEGEAKGHGKLVDATTIKQVFEVAKTYSGGLKVKIGHKEKTTITDNCGRLTNFSIDGNKCRADLHLLKSDPNTLKILELAATTPEDFGLSIVFSGEDEVKGSQKFARCTELYSADLVDAPAANPTGLFSEQTPKTMTIEELADIVGLPSTAKAEDIKAKFAELGKAPATTTALEAKVTEAVTKLEKLETAATEATKLADKARKDALVAEAGREGKIIPLSVEGIAKTSFEVLDEIVKALPKNSVQVKTKQTFELPKEADKRAEALADKRKEGIQAFNEIYSRSTSLTVN